MLTDIHGTGQFSVVVPAAYPHLFLYLSQGHSLIPRRCPELGSRALPCDGSPGGARGRRRRGGGRVAPPAAGRAHTCPTVRPGGRQGVVPCAEEGPRGPAGGRGDSRWARRGCNGSRRCGASASRRRRARWAVADPPTRSRASGARGSGRTRPGSCERRGRGSPASSHRSIHSRGSASFPGLRGCV